MCTSAVDHIDVKLILLGEFHALKRLVKLGCIAGDINSLGNHQAVARDIQEISVVV